MEILSWLNVNPDNLAEQVCRPSDYFPELKDVKVQPNDVSNADWSGGAVIFGGTGLFFPSLATVLEQALKVRRHPMVLWGVGVDTHGEHLVQWPEWAGQFDLAGLRDYGNPWDYVPCPSCMSPFFDEARDTQSIYDMVVYEHVDYPIDIIGVPRKTNVQKAEDFKRVLMFLASGKTIVTSSYHGTFWGMLLGRKVLCWKPWSSKFYGLEHFHYRVNEQNWHTVHTRYHATTSVPDYLARCRLANRQFAANVFRVLKL